MLDPREGGIWDATKESKQAYIESLGGGPSPDISAASTIGPAETNSKARSSDNKGNTREPHDESQIPTSTPEMRELLKQLRMDKHTSLKIEALPRGAGGYREWETDFFKTISASSVDPQSALKWVYQIKLAKTRNELSDPKEYAVLGR